MSQVKASAHDVAAYLLKKRGPLTAFKLQKLLYYMQAWTLVREGTPLFHERIEAWVHGPVTPEVCRYHFGKLNVGHWPHGDPSVIERDQEAARIEEWVWAMYGHYTGDEIKIISHRDLPWIHCREGLAPRERGNREIPIDLIKASFATTRYAVAGTAYAEGRLSLQQAALVLQMSMADTVALFEDMNFTRTLEIIMSGASELPRKLARIRRIRLRGRQAPSEERAKQSVIASQRIEGIDARPWLSK